MKLYGFIILIPLFVSIQISAQNSIGEIEKLVSFCQENGMFNGNILIAKKGEIIYHKSIGIADFEDDTLLNQNTSFSLGSISKQFTAFAIMLLKDKQKLQYSDTVGKIFPELPKYMHEITLKNLMQHTSGLKRTHYGEQDGLKNEEIYQNFLKTEGDTLLFKPGSDLRYSNSGYMLLAMTVERVSGQSYESFLIENVWNPLGMTNTFVMSEEDYGRPNKAIGFDGFGHKSDFNVLTYGSNGVYSSAEDLFRWNQALTSDLLMAPKDKAEAWSPAITNTGKLLDDSSGIHTYNYGFGHFIFKDDLKGVIGHVGAFGGFYNFIMKDLENDRDVVILTNNGRILPIMDMGIAIQHILKGEPYANPKISIDLALRKNHYNDIDGAIQFYYQLKKEYPNTYKFDNEWELNRLGYALMADDRHGDAVKIIKLLVSEFPNSINPYDSLGEAYFNNKQYDLSLESYQKALNMDPNYDDAPHAKEMIEKIKKIMAK